MTSPRCTQCTEDNNTNGLCACQGCRQIYCLDHMIEHRADLRNRFEQLTDAYNSVLNTVQILEQRLDENRTKIHELKPILNQIKVQLMTRQKRNNYLEKDLLRWMSEIDKLKLTLNSIEPNDLINKGDNTNSNTRTIRFLLIIIFLLGLILSGIFSCFIKWEHSLPRIAFDQQNGPVWFLEDNLVAEHQDGPGLLNTFRINRVYAKGLHHVRISFEQVSSFHAFVRIISQLNKHQVSIDTPEFSSGWYIHDRKVIHNDEKNLQNFKVYFIGLPSQSYTADIFVKELVITEIDCDNKTITLINKISKKKFELQIVFSLNRVRLHP